MDREKTFSMNLHNEEFSDAERKKQEEESPFLLSLTLTPSNPLWGILK